jgi:hypothetical protein
MSKLRLNCGQVEATWKSGLKSNLKSCRASRQNQIHFAIDSVQNTSHNIMRERKSEVLLRHTEDKARKVSKVAILKF